MASTFERWTLIVLRGLAQVAFAESAVAGILVLAAIAAVTPLGALGAAVGAVAGTVAGRFPGSLAEPEWEAGLAAPNPAIVGILWGSAFAFEPAGLGLLAVIILGCVALERILEPLFRKASLPALSAPAMATAYLVDAFHSIFGSSFWRAHEASPLGIAGVALAVVLVGGALFTKSRPAALQVAVLAAAAALASGWALETGPVGPVGLWGFTVAPAAFGMHAVFLAGSALGGWAGLFGAALGGTIWCVWALGPMASVAPPLLTPFIVAVWITIGFVGRLEGRMVFEPRLWRAAEAIRRARAEERPVVALTGAGISTASDIPDYVSGSWLHPGIPVSAYSYERFLASPECRREYWDACYDFRRVAGRARPNAGHGALAEMECGGWLAATITQNVDGLHQGAGARAVVELHGQITHVNCLSCGWVGDWPPDRVWRRYDLHCQACSGFLKPAVIAMGERIPPAAWEAAGNAVENCGVMMVVGSQLAVSSARELLSRARRGGATVVVISIGPVASGSEPGDIVLENKAEELLPALARLLDCPVPRDADGPRRPNGASP